MPTDKSGKRQLQPMINLKAFRQLLTTERMKVDPGGGACGRDEEEMEDEDELM